MLNTAKHRNKGSHKIQCPKTKTPRTKMNLDSRKTCNIAVSIQLFVNRDSDSTCVMTIEIQDQNLKRKLIQH